MTAKPSIPLLLKFVALLSASTPSLAGSVIFVDNSATGANNSATGANNGASWENAFIHLQDALAAAEYGDEIRVAAGTHRPDQGANQTLGDRLATFRLKPGVALHGGFAGADAPAAPRNIESNTTTLSGDLNADDILVHCEFFGDCDNLGESCPSDDDLCILHDNREENAFHVLTANDSDDSTVLDGFIITGGNANGADQDSQGAGIYINAANPIISNCVFRRNGASLRGGGACSLNDARPKFQGVTFSRNYAPRGGGMFNQLCSPVIYGCTFERNRGGGVYNLQKSNPNIEECIFNYNHSYSVGGIKNEAFSSPRIAGCDFYGNGATEGAGISNVQYSDPTIEDCTFFGGDSSYGGGIANNASAPVITRCIFEYNWGFISGGGVSNRAGSTPLIVDCIFKENLGYQCHGGGIANISSSPHIERCTFVANSAYEDGGAIHNACESHPTISKCDFQGNFARYGKACFNDESSPLITQCVISGQDRLFVNFESSPVFENCVFHDSSDIITNYHGSPIIRNCVFLENTTRPIRNYLSRPTISNSSFIGNSRGAVAYIYQNWNWSICSWGFQAYSCRIRNEGNDAPAESLITNCVFSGNSTTGGGAAIYVDDGIDYVALSNSIVVGNSAEGSGGGIFGRARIENSILWNNVDDADGDEGGPFEDESAQIDGEAEISYSIVQGGWSGLGGDGVLNMDPMFVGADSDDFRLLPGSPAIDAGSNAAVPPDIADLDNDGDIDLTDFAKIFAETPPTP